MLMLRWRALALATIVAGGLALAACGGSTTGVEDGGSRAASRPAASSGDPAAKPTPTARPDSGAADIAEPRDSAPVPASPSPEPTPEPAGPKSNLPDGTVALFFGVQVSSDSDLFRTANSATGGLASITIESSTKALVRYLPDSGDLDVIDVYTSKSYAPNTRRPFTSDDRLFIATKWQGGGNVDFQERDPLTLETMGPSIRGSGDIDEDNYVMVGDSLAYLVPASRDFFNRPIPGKIMLADTQTSSVSEVAVIDSYLRLQAAGESILAIKPPIFDSTADWVAYSGSGSGSGSPGGVTLTLDIEGNDVTRYSVSDDGILLWAGARYGDSGTTIRLYRADLDNPAAGVDVITLRADAGTLLQDADMDDGIVALLLGTSGVRGENRVLTYDLATGDQAIYETGLNAYDMQVMRVGE